MNIEINREYEELRVLMRLSSFNSQHTIVKDMNVAVGKVNYIVKVLVDKGFVKMGNFINEKDKSRYRYLLTKDGVDTKMRLVKKFVDIKKEEYERLEEELNKNDKQ
ncbi:MAG: MarR family EPS-associated transcriptional regulator [Campylobacterota bacterium]|nr:MarR family EPS-associated transcriptional regulator [Campylobacterota bacterium]